MPPLAFLGSTEIAASFAEIKVEMPQEADNLVKLFEKIMFWEEFAALSDMEAHRGTPALSARSLINIRE